MKKFSLLSVVLLFGIVAMLPARAGALVFKFPKTYGDPVPPEYWDDPPYGVVIQQATSGISATSPWDNFLTTLTWSVTDNEDGTYKYEYTWSTYSKDLSHIIIEQHVSISSMTGISRDCGIVV